MERASLDPRGERFPLRPVREVANRHDVDMALQDQPRFTLAGCRADKSVPLEPGRLGAREVRVGPQLVEVEAPQVDLEPGLLKPPRNGVLEVGLGVGAGDTRHPDQLDEGVDELGLVERLEDAALCGGELGSGHARHSRRGTGTECGGESPGRRDAGTEFHRPPPGWPVSDRPHTDAPTRASVGLRSERGPVLLAVMVSTGLVAIDATILAAAVPAVVGDLGGLSQFPWLFSVYLLAQAVSMPIYGKVADVVGRKPVMLLGRGTVRARLAALRARLVDGQPRGVPALQGLGAGAVQPIGITIIGDIYSVAERAKVQGYLAAVWAISSLVGPTLGGIFADYLSWRWIFFVNLPLGAVAAWMLWRRFDESAPCATPTTPTDRRARRAAAPRRHGHPARGPARGRCALGLVLAAQRGAARGVGAARSWGSCSSSDGPPIRCCRCGSSDTGSSARRWRPRSSSACCCSGWPPTSRCSLRACSARGPSWPVSRWPR